MREQQYVGINLRRRRSVIVRMNDAGEVLAVSKVDNDPGRFGDGRGRGRPRLRGCAGSVLGSPNARHDHT
jgi:hypothetical protein